MNHVWTRRLVGGMAAMSAVMAAGRAPALTTSWQVGNGIFTADANWDHGAPNADDIAVFNRGAGVDLTATFPSSFIGQDPPVYTTDRLIVRSGGVGFAKGVGPNGPSYVLNSHTTFGIPAAIIVGQLAGDAGSLTTTIPITADAAMIADAAGTVASVNVTANSWTMVSGVQDLSMLTIGNHGVGTMAISNGADVHVSGNQQRVTIGSLANSAGALLVSGAGSTLTIDHFSPMGSNVLVVGDQGGGQLTVTAGGYVSADVVNIGLAGDASVDGTDSILQAEKTINIGTNVINVDGQTRGKLTILGEGQVLVNTAATVHSSGELRGNGQLIVGDVPAGIRRSVQNDGVVSPGLPIGSLFVYGDYQQTATGKLAIQIAGRKVGTEYDRLNVNGPVELGGRLEVSFSNFAPAAGEKFDILNWSQLTGTFSTVALPALTGGLAWDSSKLYVNGELRIVFTGLSADFDENGTVAAPDLQNWKNSFGVTTEALHTQGDANADGRVDGTDFVVWQRQLGSVAVASASSAAPEPSSWVLAILAVVLKGSAKVKTECERIFSVSSSWRGKRYSRHQTFPLACATTDSPLAHNSPSRQIPLDVSAPLR